MRLRRSRNPGKQFLWFNIKKDSFLSKGKDLGLDVGCSLMLNKKYFFTKKYVGMDINLLELEEGKKNFPDATTIHSNLHDAQFDNMADFVQCVQVFVNIKFDKEKSISAVRKLISFIKEEGVLLVNTGPESIEYEEEIRQLLEKSFNKVEHIKYGNFGIDDCHPYLSLLLGGLMYYIPILRTFRGHKGAYFRCSGRF